MMKNNKKDQDQSVSTSGIGLQATRDITIISNGITYSEAKDIAMDVFRENFYRLSGEAKQIAEERANEITEKFLHKLQKVNPDGLMNASDLDFQYSLFSIQKFYARCENKNLGDVLIELLIKICDKPKNSSTRNLYHESIETASKLNEQQISNLSLKFIADEINLTKIGIFGDFSDLKSLLAFIKSVIFPHTKHVDESDASKEFLAYCNCIRIEDSRSIKEPDDELNLFWRSLKSQYGGFFQRGLTKNYLRTRIEEFVLLNKLSFSENYDTTERFVFHFMSPIIQKPTYLAFDALNIRELYNRITQFDDRKAIVDIVSQIYSEEIRNLVPIFEKKIYIKRFNTLVNMYSDTQLTIIGKMIGHVNITRLFPRFS